MNERRSLSLSKSAKLSNPHLSNPLACSDNLRLGARSQLQLYFRFSAFSGNLQQDTPVYLCSIYNKCQQISLEPAQTALSKSNGAQLVDRLHASWLMRDVQLHLNKSCTAGRGPGQLQ